MGGYTTPVSRKVVLTSLLCLVSTNQSVFAAIDRQPGGNGVSSPFINDANRNALRQLRHSIRQNHQNVGNERMQSPSGQQSLNNVLNQLHSQREQRRAEVPGILLHEPPVPKIRNHVQANAIGAGKLSRIDLDLTSGESKIVLGQKLFGKTDSVVIDVGGTAQTFQPGSQVTAGEYVAIKQVLDGGSQSLVLDERGAAAGGTFDLDSVSSRKVNDLVIPFGVSGIELFSRNEKVGVRGDLTNFGSIVAIPVSERVRNGVIFGKNINNEVGGSISGSTDYDDFDLILAASGHLKNTGNISAAGNVNLSTGTGQLTNSGSVISTQGNINVLSSADDVTIKASGGTFQAANQSINVRDGGYRGNGSIDINGGDFLSSKLNLNSGSGNIHGIVGNVTGSLNSRAGVEHFYAKSDILKIGNNCVTGDPTFANSAGGIQIQGVNTFGEAVAFLASGDITADNTAKVVANGFNVYMVAGAKVSVSAGPETTTVPGSQIGAGTTATVDFSAGTGGNIDLTASSAGTIIDTSSNTGNGGNVVLAAVANGTTGGSVLLNPASTIDTSSSFNDGSGGAVTVLAGADPASPAVTVQLGNISSSAGPGTGSGGAINIATAQPTGTGGATVVFNDLGQISSGGPIVAGTLSKNGKVNIGNVTNTGSGASDLSVTAGDDVTTGALTVGNNVTLSGASVNPASILAGGDVLISTRSLTNSGSITSTKAAGSIVVESIADLKVAGGGSFSLTGGGKGQIVLDADQDKALNLTSSLTFNPGASGTVVLRSEDEDGSIVVANGITLTVNDGGALSLGTPFLTLGDGSTINAAMASKIDINSGGQPNALVIAVPDKGAASIVTNGGTIAIAPTPGMDLVFTNLGATGTGVLNLMGGAVTTDTEGASTVVTSGVSLNADNALAMNAGNAGGIAALAFQPYVGGFVPQGGTTFFNGYSLDTVKQLLQQLKTDGYTSVATYSQGSFSFNNMFFGPTDSGAGSNKLIIQAASELGMTVSAGAFQQGFNSSTDTLNVADTMQEITYAIQQAQKYPGTVKEIIVCNESIVGPNTLNALIQLINQAKALRDSTPMTVGNSQNFTSATLAITTRQRWDVLAGVNDGANPLQANLKTMINLCEGGIYGNMYAYFDGGLPTSWPTAPSDQQAFTTAVTNSMNGTLGAFRTAFTAQGITVPIRIGETGWPSDGLRLGPLPPAPALGNATLAKWNYQAMQTWSAANNMPTVYFQGYDQPWQTVPAAQVPTTPGSSEGFFGLYVANGTSTQASFTLTSITSKFGPPGVMGSQIGNVNHMISNAGNITASSVAMSTTHLMNLGTIAASSATGAVAVTSTGDLEVAGAGTISRTGGGTGSIDFNTVNSNDIIFKGSHTFDAGAGNQVNFNSPDEGGSVTIAQGALINLPTDKTTLAITTTHLLKDGVIDAHTGTNPNSVVVVNCSGASTIANSVGDLDLSGIDINATKGDLAILSAGSIINNGNALNIDLSSGAGKGSNLLMIAGFSYKAFDIDPEDVFFELDPTSSTTGSIILNAAGHEVNIDVSGTTGAGKVEAYANGAVAFNDITAQGGAGFGGAVIAKGLNISAGKIDVTGSLVGSSNVVDLQSGVVTHDGVNVSCGAFDGGTFSVPTASGTVTVGDITAPSGQVLLRTDGASGLIDFKGALPSSHEILLLAGTGTLNLPSNVITALATAGVGGTVVVEANTFKAGASPLILNAIGTTGSGGSATYIYTGNTALIVDSKLLQTHTSGTDGGQVSIFAGGSLTVDPNGVFDAAPTAVNGNGASITLAAGTGAAGTLLVRGDLSGDANGTGKAGLIKLGSNDALAFKVASAKTKSGVQGTISIDGGTPGSLFIATALGDVSFMQDFPAGFFDFTFSSGGGSIHLKKDLEAQNSIVLNTAKDGNLSTKMLTAPIIDLRTGSKSISQKLDATSLAANSQNSVNIRNIATTPVTLFASTSGRDFSYKGSSALTTSGDIVAFDSIKLETANSDISINSNLTIFGNGSVTLKTTGAGNIVEVTKGGGNFIQADGITLQAAGGDIGNGSALRISTDKLSTLNSGIVNIDNQGTNDLTITKTKSTKSFSLVSKGGIISKQTLVASTSVSLASLSGDIGTAAKPLSINAPLFSANTGGSGAVNLESKLSTPVIVADSSSGGNFILHSKGGITLNDISVADGSLFVSSGTGKLATTPGASLTAASTGSAGSGSITLQGVNSKNSTIFLGAGTNIGTSGTGGGDVAIFVGKTPPPATNPLTPGATGNLFVTASGGGQVFVDLTTTTANLPVNNLNAIGKNVFIGGGTSANSVTLDGSVTITADPPLTMTPVSIETESSQAVRSSFSVEPTLLKAEDSTSLPFKNETISIVNSVGGTWGAHSVPLQWNLTGTIESCGFRMQSGTGSVPNESQYVGGGEGTKIEIDAVVLSDIDLGLPANAESADYTSESSNRTTVLRNGSVLLVPHKQTTVEVPQGTLSIAEGSMVLIVVQPCSTSIYNLHDDKRNAVMFKSHDITFGIMPGRHVTIADARSTNFDMINPAESIQYRGLVSSPINSKLQMFASEFSVSHAIGAIKPLRAMFSSSRKEAKQSAHRVLKTTAVLHAMNSSAEPFEPILHPRLAVYQGGLK